MDEILKKQEEEEKLEGGVDETVDANGDTSTPSEPVVDEPESNSEVPNLSNDPTPTPEESTPAQPETEQPIMEEKKFTQSEVNELMGQVRAETRDRTFKYIYGRYGVENEDGLDDLIGNAQRYDTLKEESDANAHAWDEERKGFEADKNNYMHELGDLRERIALLESGIDPERYDDAKFILKGKGLEISAETIRNELATHPEWSKQEEKKVYTPEEPVEPQPKITVPPQLGNDQSGIAKPQINEEDAIMEKYYKIK